ncbi:hypothetical protein V6N11_065102 [Hibiscus sabdariffa]|uniref:Uncharacterized protein n=1 Tax=Hibiscus sabdariffa TaxID=183260 RepID=A0ABR2SJM6_9ROSI
MHKVAISDGDTSNTRKDKDSLEYCATTNPDLYGPLMIVDSRRRHPRKQNIPFQSSKPVAPSTSVSTDISQFVILQDNVVEDSVRDIGVGKDVFSVHSASSIKGSTTKCSPKSVAIAVEPVVPSCQPVVVDHVGRGDDSNHVAVAIVDDGRFVHAYQRGSGKIKVQGVTKANTGLAKRSQLMKKRSKSKPHARPLLSDWVNKVPNLVDKSLVQPNQSDVPPDGILGMHIL